MATQQLRLDGDGSAQNIVTELSLAAVSPYGIQNISADSLVFWRESAAVPMPNHRGHVLRPYESARIVTALSDGPGVWVWTTDPGGAYIVVTYASDLF